MPSVSNEQKLRSVLKSHRLPILTLDSRWHQLYSESLKPVQIQKLEYDLNDLLKHQGSVVNDLKDLKNLKKQLMQEILLNMDTTNDELEKRRQKKLVKSKKIIEEINIKIEKLEQALDELPDLIKSANEELIMVSIKDFYERLNKNDNELKDITAWIDKARIDLKRKIIMKQDKEEDNTRIYSYMHDLLGSGCMEFFDSQNGE